ncbi:MAG TPA: protein kinase [Thermoanaerobaculia bacterium]|jgi:tetratricopeptide (TPR) repeat protein|nr:protein kinase [Thermoanaerobaculia bacterium]
MAEPDRTESVLPDASLPASIRILDPGTCLDQRFEIRRVLGVGGYAVVYLAFDRELRREVALKVLRADRMTPGALKRLRREAAVARDAASPRLVRIFDIGVSEAAVYLTMEVVEGESLRERLTRGPLSIDEAVRLTRQILEGLRVLHSLGIVHRDVKPGNVLLEPRGGVKLADFGLALRSGSDETRMTVGEGVLGTLEYVSPEQALGDEVDARGDLYSLGVVLYEMLTGELPHPGKSPLGAVLGRLRAKAPDIRQLRPEVPSWLASIVAGLLERDRSRRYPSVDAVLADLDRRSLLRTRGWRRRIVRWARVAVLLVFLVAAVWLWEHSRRPRFFQVNPIEGGGVVALDTEGHELWQIPKVVGRFNFADLHLRGDSRRYLAAVLCPRGIHDPQCVNVLSILDAETGSTVKKITLPSAHESFPGFSNRYGTFVRTLDLDHDGTDEVLVSYCHDPWWPSYTVLYEPRRDVKRVIFVGSGHHTVVGAADVDGDGRPEVILSGINNRMGWYSGIAAVKVVPWVGEGVPGRDAMYSASSPDEIYNANGGLLWYTLGPRVTPDKPGSMAVSHDKSTLAVFYHGKPEVAVGFDGFLKSFPSPLPAASRQAKRGQAYTYLREATRLLREGRSSEALPEAEAALRAAETSVDPYLVEWISRVKGKALAASGRIGEAEALFQKLATNPNTGSEAAFDAGRAFHLQGHVKRALAWYRRGLGQGATAEAGRGKYEYLEGIVFCLGELRRWEEALAEVERFHAAYPSTNPSEGYREYVRWRTGEIPTLEGDVSVANPDLSHYWQLEFRWAHKESAQTLLAAVDEEMKRSSDAKPVLLSLRGELLGRLGRVPEALAAHQEALHRTRGSLGADPIARAHYDLVAERFAAAARQAGHAREAQNALAELRLWKQRQRQIKD